MEYRLLVNGHALCWFNTLRHAKNAALDYAEKDKEAFVQIIRTIATVRRRTEIVAMR